MEKKPPLKMTPFDQMVTDDMLQVVKLMIPYLPYRMQRMAGIYAKLTELQNAISYFQPPYDSRSGRLRQKELRLDSLREELLSYLPPEAGEMMENLSQMMEMMEMMQGMNMEDVMQTMNMGDIMEAFHMGQDEADGTSQKEGQS